MKRLKEKYRVVKIKESLHTIVKHRAVDMKTSIQQIVERAVTDFLRMEEKSAPHLNTMQR